MEVLSDAHRTCITAPRQHLTQECVCNWAERVLLPEHWEPVKWSEFFRQSIFGESITPHTRREYRPQRGSQIWKAFLHNFLQKWSDPKGQTRARVRQRQVTSQGNIHLPTSGLPPSQNIRKEGGYCRCEHNSTQSLICAIKVSSRTSSRQLPPGPDHTQKTRGMHAGKPTRYNAIYHLTLGPRINPAPTFMPNPMGHAEKPISTVPTHAGTQFFSLARPTAAAQCNVACSCAEATLTPYCQALRLNRMTHKRNQTKRSQAAWDASPRIGSVGHQETQISQSIGCSKSHDCMTGQELQPHILFQIQ